LTSTDRYTFSGEGERRVALTLDEKHFADADEEPSPNTLSIARLLVDQFGFSVIPIDHPDTLPHPDPDAIGKTPILRWKSFQTTHPTAEQLVEWFGNGTARNLAVVTGAISRVVVVDGDSTAGLTQGHADGIGEPVHRRFRQYLLGRFDGLSHNSH
jgi:hypothetical protein